MSRFIRQLLTTVLASICLLLTHFELAVAAEPTGIFRTDRINALILMIVFSAAILWYTRMARQGKSLFLRKIPGLNAVEEAVGRAT
ncbi:MAG TPA: DUF6754 domain-containing protein, partial [candidate division Zixibacteria bacterium]|nr:DUF6754 domain-containing protein [candidate division Zixibacteria bacterium]